MTVLITPAYNNGNITKIRLHDSKKAIVSWVHSRGGGQLKAESRIRKAASGTNVQITKKLPNSPREYGKKLGGNCHLILPSTTPHPCQALALFC